MFKRIRKAFLFPRDFKYFFVSERGSTNGRPHFHGLIFFKKFSSDDKLFPAQLEASVRKVIFNEWRRNYGSNRVPIWKPLFTYRSKIVSGKRFSNFDVHYVVPHSSEHGSDDVAFYVTKYVLKPCKKERKLQQALRLNLDPDEYYRVWSIVKSRCFCSKGFGAASDIEIDYVKSCVERSRNDPNGFQFFNSDGSLSSLSRYYRKFISADQMISSVSARGGPISYDDRTSDEKDLSIENGQRIINQVALRDVSALYDD